MPARLGDERLSSEKDCDRILYASAFRRLTGVTQVTGVDEIPLFHNRLTHTLKVATLAERLCQDLIRGGFLNPDEVDPNVAKAAGMAHDLGHPPFGHIAEEVLQLRCTAAGIDGFEGNAQSFRILTKLARGGSSESGLGLSQPTLNAVLKYPWFRRTSDPGKDAPVKDRHRWRKWGAYLSESAQFKAARDGDESDIASLEAQIMDWCDDVSYALHDLEDFYRVGLLPLERLDDEANWIAATSGVALRDNPYFDPVKLSEALKVHTGGIWPNTPYNGSDSARESIHAATNTLIDQFFAAVTVSSDRRKLIINDTARHEVMLLKQLTWQYVINSPSLATIQRGQMEIIGTLFDRTSEWLMSEEALHRFPVRLRRLYDSVKRDAEETNEPSTETGVAARATADYLSGLTEGQAVDLYQRLTGAAPKSILEGWVRL